MLILTRKPGQSVRIGKDVTVTVLGVKGNHVRLGIEAPRSVSVHREEVYERIGEARPNEAGQIETAPPDAQQPEART